MKLSFRLIILFFLITASAIAQSNWSAILPAQFPTNASGQIHGISRVSQLKFHPTNANKMYAVSARGGLFISTNAGANWSVTPGTDFMPSARLASVCIDFTDDQIIYLGTGDHNYYYSGAGVWKSTNGGITFTQLGLTGKLVVEMIMDPTNHNTIVAATNTGIYKTTNAGVTWTLKSTSRTFDDLKLKENPSTRTMFAATTDSAFFRSTDFGDTWTQINNGIVLPSGVTSGNGVRIALTPADSNTVYLAMVANGGMIYKSTDGGSTFLAKKTSSSPYITYYSNSSADHGQGDYNHGIGVDRTNPNTLWYVAHCVWKSTDAGVTWTQQTIWSAVLHTDMHQMIENPYNSAQLYNVNDGGVWLSTDGGASWNPKSDGIYGYEIYHGNCSPTNKDIISIGTQDNGELYANSTKWFTNRGGDWSSQCSFDYRPASSMVYYNQNNTRRLVNGSSASYGLPAQITVLQDIAFHRGNPDLAFAGDSIIVRTTNLRATTPTWTQIASLGKKIMAMHCSYADSSRIYVITADAMIYVCTNALSATPVFTSYALPNSTSSAAYITSVKNSPNTLYITCNTKVYRSTDNGATWTNITLNLPSVNHARILADEYSTNELVLIASDNAVYYKTINSPNWIIYNQNLPSRTNVVDLSIYNDNTNNTALRVATYGRGMWESSISGLRTLTANFTADKLYPCPGTSVQFSDLSTGTPVTWSWSFPGGSPATSTVANPVVTYNASGSYNVTLTISDGTTNNTLTKTSYIKSTGSDLPLTESFEGSVFPPAGWTEFDDGGDGIKWKLSSSASGYGTGFQSMYFDNWNTNATGKKDEVRTLRINGSSYNSVTLNFDVAYWSYTNQTEQDTLQVLISTDCGNTFTQIYNKGGATLSTVAGNSTNAFTPTSTQWRTESVSLNSYIGQSLIVAFRNVARYGNNLYIDNINVNGTVAANAGVDKTICPGGSTSIGSAPASGINYSWSPAGGLSSSTVSNPVASPSATQQYILTATHAQSGISSKDTVIVTIGNCSYSYNVKLFIQGYYIGSGVMRAAVNPVLYPSLCDTVKIELHNATSPYSLVENSTGTINTNGTGQFTLSPATLGQSYYLVVKNRNILETWSAAPVSFTSGGTYDFTTAANKAYGSNQIAVDAGSYAIYNGDITNGVTPGMQDGLINTSDYNEMQSTLGQFLTNYNFHDLTGDFLIESMDYSLMENNINLNLQVRKP